MKWDYGPKVVLDVIFVTFVHLVKLRDFEVSKVPGSLNSCSNRSHPMQSTWSQYNEVTFLLIESSNRDVLCKTIVGVTKPKAFVFKNVSFEVT